MVEREGFLHGRDLGALRELARRVKAGAPDLASLHCLLFNLCRAGAAGSGSRCRRCAKWIPTSSSAPATPSPPSVSLSPPSTPASSIPRRWSPSRHPDLVRRPQLAAGPAFVVVGPTTCEMGTPPASLSVLLHLLSFLVYFILFLYLLLWFHSCMATGLHSDRDARLSCPLPFSACKVSVVLVSFVSFRQLLLRRSFDDAAFICDIGSSFSYLWQRLQHHLSVAGICLLRWLIRLPLNRRCARSFHLGASVLDASVYSPRWHASLSRRLSRRCCVPFWSQDLVVSRFPFGNLLVLRLF